MDEAKRRKIEILAADAHDKRMRYEGHQMMNTPSDSEERKKAAVAYAVAKAEMIEANRLLEDEMNA
jgi:hypothetical protein